MNRLIKYLALTSSAALLLACGGGGGGGSGNLGSTATDAISISSAIPAVGGYMPHMVEGRFSNDGVTYIVVAGWIFTGGSEPGPDAPIKIYKVSSKGVPSDVTEQIIGANQYASVSVPLVADFNGDGVDDIFLAGFKDGPVYSTNSVVYLSRSGRQHERVTLPESVWIHGSYVIDIDADGDVDVIGSTGEMWINNGQGNFSFRPYNYNLNNEISGGYFASGMGVCAGDFNGSGRPQIVITDVSNTADGAPIADTIVFELNSSLKTVSYHVLPPPILDRGASVEGSHDVSCRVGDLNGDGRLDIVVYSRPNTVIRSGWTDEGRVQILINRGNFVFEDVTDVALLGYPGDVMVTYAGVIRDLNGDGKLDLWMGEFDGVTGLANQAWLNSGDAVFSKGNVDYIRSLNSNGPMLPIKVDDGWRFLFSQRVDRGTSQFALVGYEFKITNKSIKF